MKIKDIGEFGLIERIAKKSNNSNIIVDIGDDAAVVDTKGLQVLTTDALVEGDHFRCDWFTPEQIGMKAIEINVSDVVSMGGIPKYALLSLCLPNDLYIEFVDDLYFGFRKSCEKHSIDIIGGNFTRSDKIVISITMIGKVNEKNVCKRSDAKPKDFILVSGHIGNGRAGLRVFQENLKDFKKVKKKYLEPKAKTDFSKKYSHFINSMIDISDGLAPEIKHICDESKCGAVIYKDKIPILDNVRRVAKILSEDEYDYALYGGEDFELFFTVSKENLPKVEGFVIGEITKVKDIYLSSNKGKEKIEKSGYDHFSNSILD